MVYAAMILSGGRVLEQMIKQVAHIIQPKARGYFGIDAKAYGVEGHVDLSALKVIEN